MMRPAALLLLAALLAAPAGPVRAQAASPEDTVYLDLEDGRVVIAMRPDLAPRHVERLKHLIRGGYYDGLVFHRVIEDFAAQTGDIRNDGTGPGTGRTLNAEFSRTPQVRGTVSMARGSRRHSADAEWFIVLADKADTRSALDGKYTVWGAVVSGMEVVDRIPKGDKARDGRGIVNPARIVKMRIAADADAPDRRAPAEMFARPDIAQTARDFSASEFKCAALRDGDGVTPHAALARLWTHGFLAGRFKAADALTFAPSGGENTLDPALDAVCEGHPYALLVTAARQELARTPRPLPAATPAFPLDGATCRSFTDARKARDKGPADLAGLWAFAYIQGYKSVSQPEMEIPHDSRPRLLEAVAGVCAKSPDLSFADVTGAVAARVRIK